MTPLVLFLLMMAAVAYAQQSDTTVSLDFASAASSISAYISSPTFVPYSRPNQKVEEWIALGDSYTAGTGCNGQNEIVGGGDAARGKRSYPMQMSTDTDSWSFINNGDDALPRFSFSAYTGDTTVELITEQLNQGPWKSNNVNLPRHPFGSPQLAVVTIGGNDAKLSTILNNCIYRAWLPKDCQSTLNDLTQSLDDGSLRDKINTGLFHVAQAGRQAGGANPRESFQVYVTSYMTFFNQSNTECNDISWNYWDWSTPKLTTDLRAQLNGLTLRVNEVVKNAAQDLRGMGVIYIDGLESSYEHHRYCEPGHTNPQMIDYDTWFWSSYAHSQTTSEGPGDPENPYAATAEQNGTQLLLDFLFPNGTVRTTDFSESSPPWSYSNLASKYPDYDSLIKAMVDDDNATIYGAPFNLLRSFHPKGTAYGNQAQLFMGAIADNRGLASVNNSTSTSKPPVQSTSTTTPTSLAPSTPTPTQAPPAPDYAPGTCSFHLTETQVCDSDSRNLFALIRLVDDKKNEIGAITANDTDPLGVPINAKDPYSFTSKLPMSMVVTGEHRGDYIQFTYGGTSWRSTTTMGPATCSNGGWDPKGGPQCSSNPNVSNRNSVKNMDCSFPC